MAVWYEQPTDSGNFTVDAFTASVTKRFFLQGLIDEQLVEVFALRNSPNVFRGLPRKSVKATRVGNAEWFVELEYATIPPQEAPTDDGSVDPPDMSKWDPAFSFDTTGQTLHVTQSIATISKTTARGDTTLGDKDNKFTLDNLKAIGLSQDSVAGTDVYAPQFQWTFEETRLMTDLAQLVRFMNLTGTVNVQTFCTFPPGSTLYLGASGRFTGNDRWRITHKFSSLPNRKQIPISDTLTVKEKEGWDYLWVGYVPKQIGNKILQVPDAAYVERVYPRGDFFLLGLGGCLPFVPPAGGGGGGQNKNVRNAAGNLLGAFGFDVPGQRGPKVAVCNMAALAPFGGRVEGAGEGGGDAFLPGGLVQIN